MDDVRRDQRQLLGIRAEHHGCLHWIVLHDGVLRAVGEESADARTDHGDFNSYLGSNIL